MSIMQAPLSIIRTYSDFEQRFWVDVTCSDPYWKPELKRIEVHRDVAYHIFRQEEVIRDLREQLRDNT